MDTPVGPNNRNNPMLGSVRTMHMPIKYAVLIKMEHLIVNYSFQSLGEKKEFIRLGYKQAGFFFFLSSD